MRYILTLVLTLALSSQAYAAASIVAAFSKWSSAGLSVDAGKQGTNTMQVIGASFSKPGGKPTMTINANAQILTPLDVIAKGPWTDVRAYGAVAGSSNSSSAIQAALDNVASGGTVILKGSFTSTQLTVSVPCTIDLQGGTLTAHASTSGDFITINADYVTFINGTVDGNKANATSSQHTFQINGDHTTYTKLKVVNSKSDAFWLNDNLPAYGIADYTHIEHCEVVNPGRNGLFVVRDTNTYRNSLVIRDLKLTNDANTGQGAHIEYVTDLTLDNIQATAGFAEKIQLSYVEKAVIAGRFIADDDLTNDLIDTTFTNNLTIKDSVFSGRRAGVAVNPSNSSGRVSVSNIRVYDCRSGVVGFENFADIEVITSKFYRVDTPVDFKNSSIAIARDNYFEDCKRGVLGGTSNADSKINYDNLILIVHDNIMNRSGSEFVQVNYGALGSFKHISVKRNDLYNVHTKTAAEAAWGSYTATSDVYALFLPCGTTKAGLVEVEGNTIRQDAAYQAGVAGGGVFAGALVQNTTKLVLGKNSISRNCNKTVYLNSATIDELITDKYVDSGNIVLSGAALSAFSFPVSVKGDLLGYRIVYTVTTSADAGINLLIRDGITGTVKTTLASAQSAAAGTVTMGVILNTAISIARNVEVYSPGGKTGAGACYLRAYYLEAD